jgi:hypothetical protein
MRAGNLTMVLWALTLVLGLFSLQGCSQWLAMWDDAVDAYFVCSRDPSSPGCVPFGWGYRPGMGM